MMKQTGRKGDKPSKAKKGSGASLPYLPTTLDIRIKRFDNSMPLPTYQTNGALAVDLYARERVRIPNGASRVVPTNIAIELPEGVAALVIPRSSLPLKTPLILGNSPGLVDTDYCGDGDEIGVIAKNTSALYYVVEKGFRLGQLLLVPAIRANWVEVESLENDDRGGYGTTGDVVVTEETHLGFAAEIRTTSVDVSNQDAPAPSTEQADGEE